MRAVSLDDLLEAGTIQPPDYLKIDVEGAESSVLDGARRLLAAHAPTIFLATHGEAVHAQCLERLEGLGYAVRPLVAGAEIETCDELVATRE